MTFARTLLSVGLVAGIVLVGNAGRLAQGSDTGETQTPEPSSQWSQEQWPFPIDQWGTGRAFRCSADRCGRELHLYLRAKIGFCRCATGVADDDEIERVGDLELIGADYKPLAAGHPVRAGIMSGRARLFAVTRPLHPALPIFTIALAHTCDAIVATLAAEGAANPVAEAQALDFLRSAAIQHWVEAQGGSP
jgi:hypothetical protein